jgi:hypothetical protein
MNGLMAKLENMFVLAATFAEVASVKVHGGFSCLSNHKGRTSKNDSNLYEEIFTVARDLYERSAVEGRIDKLGRENCKDFVNQGDGKDIF